MTDTTPEPFSAVFEEPPPRGQTAKMDALKGFVEALHEHPKMWARLMPGADETDHPNNRAVTLRKFPGVEVRTTLTVGSKTRCHIWARWMPDATVPPSAD